MQERPFEPLAELSDEVRTRFFVDGKWRAPAGSERFELISPVSEEVTLSVPAGSPADMDAAIVAARRAFDQGEWPRLPVPDRARYLLRIADEIDRRTKLFERVWIGQVGAPRWFVSAILGAAALHFRYYAGLADSYPFEEESIDRRRHAEGSSRTGWRVGADHPLERSAGAPHPEGGGGVCWRAARWWSSPAQRHHWMR